MLVVVVLVVQVVVVEVVEVVVDVVVVSVQDVAVSSLAEAYPRPAACQDQSKEPPALRSPMHKAH